MISLSAKVDARSRTPLFHVQPRGWPSIAQMKMGFFSLAAVRCASSRETFHGIVRQPSVGDGRNSRWIFRNSPIESCSPASAFDVGRNRTANRTSNTIEILGSGFMTSSMQLRRSMLQARTVCRRIPVNSAGSGRARRCRRRPPNPARSPLLCRRSRAASRRHNSR